MESNTIPTIEIVTTHGHKVVIKEFITGFDKRKVGEAYLDAPADLTPSKKYALAVDTALHTVVVSVDGVSENVEGLVLGLPMEDTDEIVDKVNEITGTKKKEKNTSAT